MKNYLVRGAMRYSMRIPAESAEEAIKILLADNEDEDRFSDSPEDFSAIVEPA